MVRTLPLLLILFTLTSCVSRTTAPPAKIEGDPLEQIIDLLIANRSGQTVEFPYLYDSLTSTIPVDSLENLIIADMLQQKGFEMVGWGHGNYPPRGPRIVSETFKKDDCYCTVSKIYYSTTYDTLYEMAERISCLDSLAYLNEIN